MNIPTNVAMPIKVRKLHADAVIPVYATEGAAGFDLVAVEDTIIEPGETALIRTGLAFEIPSGYEMQIRARSGITLKTKLRVQLGTVDSDYRGEVGVMVDNIRYDTHTDLSPFIFGIDGMRGIVSEEIGEVFYGTYIIRKGDRIAQAVITPVVRADFELVDELTETRRGSSGFGSTGVSAENEEGVRKHSVSYPTMAEVAEMFAEELPENKLAVDSGICPFPYDCNERFTCTKTACNYDECNNGFAFRRS